MKKQIGIWLDNKEAYIITVNPNESTVEKIESEVEDFHLKGGSPAKTPYGAVDATSETKLLARKKQQFRKYYQNIMDKVKDADELLIMGPAEAKIGLRTKMTETKSFQPFIKGFESADSVSDNQKIERTREFFGQKTRV